MLSPPLEVNVRIRLPSQSSTYNKPSTTNLTPALTPTNTLPVRGEVNDTARDGYRRFPNACTEFALGFLEIVDDWVSVNSRLPERAAGPGLDQI